MVTRQERDATDRFSERYRLERGDVIRTIEQAVIGGDWGANGYTTIAQADELAELLDLQQRSLLLDVGAGRGWPGLYLAATTGCSVILADVPMEGLSVARTRARQDALEDRAWCVNANARDLPFRAATIDAVVHTDVLCCLRPKLSVLRALRRILRPTGRMAFQTIHVTPGLADRDRRRAHRSGPWAVASAHDPAELLRRADFVAIHTTDQTDDFRATARAWIDEWAKHRTALVELYGDTAFETRQQERLAQLKAIEDGLLQRSLTVGTCPDK